MKRGPPGPDIYDRFCRRIMSAFGPSETTSTVKFLQFPSLGDGSAATMAAAMLQLLPEAERIPSIVYRELFLQKIPSEIRNSLGELKSEDKDITFLAARVDRLIASRTKDAASVSAVKTGGRGRSRKKKAEVKDAAQASDRSSDKASRKRDVTPHPDWCYYHEQFGGKAEKCRPPCTFPPSLQEVEIQQGN